MGRACIGKCVDRLIEQLDELRRSSPPPLADLQLELVGDVDPQVDQLLDSRPWITAHGSLPTDERDRIVNTSMGLVSPSLLDSLGLVNLEAAFVGTPVLVNTDCPAFAELREQSAGAIIGFSIYEADSLGSALRQLSRTSRRMQLAADLQRWATARFTAQAFSSSLHRLLQIRERGETSTDHF